MVVDVLRPQEDPATALRVDDVRDDGEALLEADRVELAEEPVLQVDRVLVQGTFGRRNFLFRRSFSI